MDPRVPLQIDRRKTLRNLSNITFKNVNQESECIDDVLIMLGQAPQTSDKEKAKELVSNNMTCGSQNFLTTAGLTLFSLK